MLHTRFTDLVGCTVPIQQAGMGSLAIPGLAKAVADAGGQGMVSLTGLPLPMIAEILDKLRRQTTGVLGVNLLMPFVPDQDYAREMVRISGEKVRVVDFFEGDPDPELVEIAHGCGAVACWQVGSREEAVAAVDAGCDLVVAQGIEAGGHVRGRISLLALLDEILESVEIPVLAAGGIGTGRAMAAALAAGAAGVRVGTRFIAAQEAGAHPAYVQALVAARAGDTVYTDRFSVGWPDAPHRVLRSCLEAAEAFPDDVVGERVSLYTGAKVQVHRFEVGVPTMLTTGEIAAMPLWAGESVGGIRRLQLAGEIVSEMAREAEGLLRRWANRLSGESRSAD
jgi:NAD(P)H-dependent flavin oxidoreductase YrpB (nitropropane dioxygenase family)